MTRPPAPFSTSEQLKARLATLKALRADALERGMTELAEPYSRCLSRAADDAMRLAAYYRDRGR